LRERACLGSDPYEEEDTCLFPREGVASYLFPR
jgi:hypothetical protein